MTRFVRWTSWLGLATTFSLAWAVAQPAATQPAKPAATQPAKPATQPARPAAKAPPKIEPGPSIAPIVRDALGEAAWTVTGNIYTVEPIDGESALSIDAKTVTLDLNEALTGPQVFETRVRLRPAPSNKTDSQLTINFGFQDAKNPGYAFRILGAAKTDTVSAMVTAANKPLNAPTPEENAAQGWAIDRANRFTYQLRAYTQFMPGWPEQFRERIEHDMASLPTLADAWLKVRVEFSPSSVSFWLDDRLVAVREQPPVNPEGKIRLTLAGGVQLKPVKIAKPRKIPAHFIPIQIESYFNTRTFLQGKPIDYKSLVSAASSLKVPFALLADSGKGNDHIDVSRSLLREANATGYIKSNGPRLAGSDLRDPARIQIRIPFKQYDRLYFLAASDDRPDSVPTLSAIFYKPDAGFSQTVATTVPSALKVPAKATPVPVKLEGGAAANLYLVEVPIDPAMLTAFSDLDVFEVELTKEVRLWRSYPDPISYGYHQAGLPSSVQIYAMTLGVAPVGFNWTPDQFGHVWQHDQTPGYTAHLTNRTGAAQQGTLTVVTRSYDGTENTKAQSVVKLDAAAVNQPFKLSLPVKLFGYHDVTATLEIAGKTWTEKRSLVRLAPDTRSTRWTEGKGAMFGYWTYNGGHYTPDANHITRLMTWAGARQVVHVPATDKLTPETLALIEKHWGVSQAGAWEVAPQAWLADDNADPAKIAAFQADVIEKIKKYRSKIPQQFLPDQVYFYAEPHISSRLSAGNIPDYWGEKPYEYTDAERTNLKKFLNTSRVAAEAVRKEFPDLKIFIPWGDPGFVWPLLRSGFPKELFDGCGVDTPGFERIPERQLHEQSVHRLFLLNKEIERAGIKKARLQFCEGLFVPTEPGGVSWREQMDIYNRWSLISMGYGVDRFYSGWFAFDCGSYYGAEHYGGCGIQRRIPFCDPKPAYAAFATMTDKLNEANFDKWLPTGSLSTYCMTFKHESRGQVATLWTLRGTRPVTLTLSADAKVLVTDAMNNTKEIASKDKQVTLTTDQSVTYITFTDSKTAVLGVAVGEPDNSDQTPAPDAKLVGDMGDGSWTLAPRKDEILENNHWAMMHYPGKFSSTIDKDAKQGNVFTTTLEKQEIVRELMPWYTVAKPAKPIAIAGAPSHVGLWVKGNSDWGRVIYILRDAKGERWTSIGAKDDYNCDDSHSWSQFCFDGWRYLRFEMPGHTGYDSYRKAGTNWWRGDGGDDIVDLPLALEEIIIEQRSHILYVNDVQKTASDKASFGKLFIEYETPADATENAVAMSKVRMPRPTGVPELPNPMVELAKSELPPTKLIKLTPPEHYYDGTRMHVSFEETPAAVKYYFYVGAYPDGRGAVNLTPNGLKQNQLVTGMRPKIKLYFWIVYEDKDKKLSRPSPVHEEILVDNFKEK